jgi:hypothetical protein
MPINKALLMPVLTSAAAAAAATAPLHPCSYFAMLINKAPESLVTATANYTLDW